MSVLAVNNNKLFNLSAQVLQDTPNLYRISISRNKLQYIDPGAFSGLEKLAELQLNDNKITKLHEDVFKDLKTLYFLKLQNNKLTDIRPKLWGYGTLLDLNLSGNRLTNLTCKVFERLRQLYSMNIENNSIKDIIPCVFEGMYNIKTLKLGYNLIETLEMDTFSDVDSVTNLGLGNNKMMKISIGAFRGLKRLQNLDLKGNQLPLITPGVLRNLTQLQVLNISNNRFTEFRVSMFQGANLRSLDMTRNSVEHLWYSNSSVLENLTTLMLKNNSVTGIDKNFFSTLTSLKYVDLTGNIMNEINEDSFLGLKNTTTLLVDSHGTCCFVIDGNCKAVEKRHPFFSCGSLLPHIVLDVFMWLLAFLAIAGNLGVLLWRLTHKMKTQKVQWLLITNLAASDFMMGIYMVIIASADHIHGEYFPLYSDHWRFSPYCKAAGFLTVVSSEASVFFITFISIDRLIGIEFPFSSARPRLKWRYFLCHHHVDHCHIHRRSHIYIWWQ